MSLLSVWESGHHFMVESWYDVNVHMENFLRGSFAIRLSDTNPIGTLNFSNTLYHFGDCCEDPPCSSLGISSMLA